MSEKVRTQHLERKAILYVRQSSPYQVTHNLESQELLRSAPLFPDPILHTHHIPSHPFRLCPTSMASHSRV